MKWMPHPPEALTIHLCNHRGYITRCSSCHKSFHWLNKNLVYTACHEDRDHFSIKGKEDYIDIMCPHCGQVQETLIPHRTRVFRDESEFWPTDLLKAKKAGKLRSFKKECPYCKQENTYSESNIIKMENLILSYSDPPVELMYITLKCPDCGREFSVHEDFTGEVYGS